MASLIDYFSPGPMAGVTPDPQAQSAIGSFMSDPKALSALLAFGTQAMIPQWGGGTVQFAKGVGGAGEAMSAQTAQEQKQQEIDSKAGLREAQAGAAEARANTAATRSSLTGQIEEGKRERATTMARIRLSNMYQNYVRNTNASNALVDKQNNDVLKVPGTPMAPKAPVLDMDTWVRNNPLINQLGLTAPQPPAGVGAGDGTDESVLPSGASSTAGATAEAPRDRKMRTPGTVYSTPKGPLKWTGQMWVAP